MNRCLDKEASVPYKSTRTDIIDAARNHGNYTAVFDSVQNFIKSDVPLIEPLPEPAKNNELGDKQLLTKIESLPFGSSVLKILHLYIKCIISLEEFRRFLLPVHKFDQKLYQHLSHLAEEVESKRRKFTIFAPLNELVDQNYPLSRIGNSYSLTPDGYSNFGKSWGQNRFEFVLNRKCVSVPLGQESSFIIARKN